MKFEHWSKTLMECAYPTIKEPPTGFKSNASANAKLILSHPCVKAPGQGLNGKRDPIFAKRKLGTGQIDQDCIPIAETASKKIPGHAILHLALDEAPERPCPVDRVIAAHGKKFSSLLGKPKRDLPFGQTLSQIPQHHFRDLLDLLP